jgi:hypothetical protein
MKEQRITFETAKLAKEKGFHWRMLQWAQPPYPGGAPRLISLEGAGDEYGNPCFSEKGKEITPKYYNLSNSHWPRPTQDLLNKWLREKHKIYLQILLVEQYNPQRGWGYELTYFKNDSVTNTDETASYPTYEEAMEAGLQRALKLVENG